MRDRMPFLLGLKVLVGAMIKDKWEEAGLSCVNQDYAIIELQKT